MTDGTNNSDPSSEQPGWASPTPPSQQQPTPPPTYQQQTPPPYQNGYQQPGAFPPPVNQYGQQPKKKSKLWLWITLAVVIPMLLCALGAGACTIFAVSEAKPPIDATNNFYKALKAEKDLDSLTCERYLRIGSFNDYFYSEDNPVEPLDKYVFDDVELNGDNQAVVRGTVTRDGIEYETEVQLDKDNGKYKVCRIDER